MLVLKLRKNEKVVMTIEGKEVVLKIIGYKGDQVLVGFKAPDDISILRENAKTKEPKLKGEGNELQ